MNDPGPDDRSSEATPGDGRAIMVCSPSGSDANLRACTDHLMPRSETAVDVLCVSFSGRPTERIAALRDRGVEVGRTAAATVGAGTGGNADPDRSFSVDSIESVDELSDLGMYVRDVLTDWSAGGNSSVLCFDSVTELLEWADLELTFEFLLVLVEGIRETGVVSHFHFDPGAHDQPTRRTLEHLFDEVVDPADAS